MTSRFARLVLALLVGATPTLAQQDASSRLHSTTQRPRKLTYEVASGTLRPEKGPSAFFGPDVVYNNTCILTTLFFAGMSPTDVFLDNGQVPSSGNGQLPGCDDSLLMNGFSFGYCSDQAGVDIVIGFHELHDNCTGISSATGSTAVYTLTGLPGTNTSVPLCWAFTIDLMGTSTEWAFLADGDGIWANVPALDTFGYTYEITNVTGTATGIILAGHPIFFVGCDFAVGTVYEVADPTGSAPLGTGYGTVDNFGLMNAGAYAGCFFFGGWPLNPWSSYYMVVHVESARCPGSCVSTVVCDGTGTNPIPCPCTGGNGGFPDQGCLHSGGVGASLCVEDSSIGNFTAVASNLPLDVGGVFLIGTAQSGGLAIFGGITCVAGSTLRLQAGFQSAPGMRVTSGGDLTAEANTASPGYCVIGSTYVMTYWFRDALSMPNPPCDSFTNFSTTVSFSML